MPPYMCTWAQYEPALGSSFGRIREAATGDGSGVAGTYKVSASGVNV